MFDSRAVNVCLPLVVCLFVMFALLLNYTSVVYLVCLNACYFACTCEMISLDLSSRWEVARRGGVSGSVIDINCQRNDHVGCMSQCPYRSHVRVVDKRPAEARGPAVARAWGQTVRTRIPN